MVYISYNCVENKAYLLEHDDELITEIINAKEMSFAKAVELALKLGINIVEDDDDLTDDDWEEVREMLQDYDIETYDLYDTKMVVYAIGTYNRSRCNGLFK